MKIAIDIDNVVYTTTQAVVDQFNEYTGENLSINDILSYRIENYVAPKHEKLVGALFCDKNTWKRVKVLPDCVEVVRRLFETGHEIYFATATIPENIYKKAKFLKRTFPFLDIDKCLISIRNKQLLNVDVLIDDYENNLIGGNYHGILLTYPWNDTWKCPSTFVTRCDNWLEVEQVISHM